MFYILYILHTVHFTNFGLLMNVAEGASLEHCKDNNCTLQGWPMLRLQLTGYRLHLHSKNI